MEENYFQKLNSVNVNGKTEKKNGLTYLSWAWAWGEIKKAYPDSYYTVYENKDGWNYHTDGRTAWVKTGVTVNGIEHIEYLPVMDNRNKSIPLDHIDSFVVNKTIQRSLTKACARHGIGLYVYAGEDLPEDESGAPASDPAPKAKPKSVLTGMEISCSKCGKPVGTTVYMNGQAFGAREWATFTSNNNGGKQLCRKCYSRFLYDSTQDEGIRQLITDTYKSDAKLMEENR